MEKLAYSICEMAKVLSISKTTAYELSRRADFPKIKVGNRTLIPKKKLEEWVEAESMKLAQ